MLRDFLVTVFFEVFFYFEGCHAARAGGGDCLTVAAVLDISAGVDAGDDVAVEGGEDVVGGADVAVFVEVEDAFEGAGVGDVADTKEHEADREDELVAGDTALEAQALDVLLFHAKDFFDGGVGEELDLGVGHGALEHDFRGAKPFGAVDEGDLGGEAGEEHGFFHGAVTSADDGDLFARGEEAVAGGAGADAVADEGLLRGQVKPSGTGAARDDESAGVDDFFADLEDEGGPGEID